MEAIQVPGSVQPAESGLNLPQLSLSQALYISLLLDDAASAATRYEDAYGISPDLETWYQDIDYIAALQLADSNRPLLFRALTNALFGKALRSLSAMLDRPQSQGKAIELLLRLNGMLIDRVKDSAPNDLRELITLLRSKTLVQPTDYHAGSPSNEAVR